MNHTAREGRNEENKLRVTPNQSYTSRKIPKTLANGDHAALEKIVCLAGGVEVCVVQIQDAIDVESGLGCVLRE